MAPVLHYASRASHLWERSMLQKFLGFAVISAVLAACATGQLLPERDGGPAHQDSGKGNDGSTTKDSGPAKDSSTPIQDGSTCNLTVCGSFCVDTTQDDLNCGQCNNACPSGSSCTASKCQCSGGMSLCTSGCYDLTSDMNNCGTCGNICTGTTTCMNSTCQAVANGAPPKGNCAHDLCTADIGALTPGCDPNSCVTNVCNADSFCCDTEWDSICTGEVVDYCPPYSCP
jgi:hypothetical protein